MKNLIFYLISLFVLTSCGETKTNKTSLFDTKKEYTTKEKSSQEKNLTKFKTKTDSIDFVNNQVIIDSEDKELNKALIEISDSSITITANIRLNHRIFGFSEPNKNSKRMLLLSVFTDDVENNPFECKLGAYYDTSNMANKKIKYLSTIKDFIKAQIIDVNSGKRTTIFFEKKYLEFLD